MRTLKAYLAVLACCVGFATAQEASSIDADGNTVIYSVGIDEQGFPTTVFLETIPAAAGATTTDDLGDGAVLPTATDVNNEASALPPAALPDPTSNPVVTRNDDVAPGETTLTSRPVTYVIYLTIDGVQVTSIATFTPSTPTPSTTIPPRSGTMVDIATYLPPPPSSTTTSDAASRYYPSAKAWKASLSIATSMLIGALVIL